MVGAVGGGNQLVVKLFASLFGICFKEVLGSTYLNLLPMGGKHLVILLWM